MDAQIEALDTAIALLGSQAALAARCGVVQGAVGNWKYRKSIPAEYCVEIEKATRGAVRCEDLRPDVDWAYLRRPVKARTFKVVVA